MSAPVGRAQAPPAAAEHLPLSADDPGCLAILSDRLRESPGVVAIEADFRDNTLTVRYRPSLVEPDRLNALADFLGDVAGHLVVGDATHVTSQAGWLQHRAGPDLGDYSDKGVVDHVVHVLDAQLLEEVKPQAAAERLVERLHAGAVPETNLLCDLLPPRLCFAG
ncbi:MAG: hypothetical protein AAB113_04160, partial [Candidatus Eisenbacteria bacterium]